MPHDHVGNILFFVTPSDRDLWTLICFTVLCVVCFYVFRGKLNTETGFRHSYQVAKYLVLSGLCIPRGWYPSRASHIFFASNFFEARWHRAAKDIITLLVSVRNFQRKYTGLKKTWVANMSKVPNVMGWPFFNQALKKNKNNRFLLDLFFNIVTIILKY